MGDRVVIQVIKSDETPVEFSPVAYGHWHGEATPKTVKRLRTRMATRPGDVAYTFARLIQEMTVVDPDGNLSFGVWNASAVLTKDDSHGDAGVVLIDLAGGKFKVTPVGGYLRPKDFK